jgi:hypothetical protein
MKIINCTPHDLWIVGEDGKFEYVLTQSGQVAWVKPWSKRSGAVNGIGLFELAPEVIDLPEMEADTIFVVSEEVRKVAPRGDLVSPARVVKKEHGGLWCEGFAL